MKTERETDALLAQSLRRKRRDAYSEAMSRYGARVSGVVGAMVRDPRDVQELTQDVFIRAFEAIGRYDPREASLATWLCRIAYNRAVDHLRRRGELLLESEEKLPDSADDSAELTDDIILLERALELLNPLERTALNLVYFEEMSLEQAAYVLDTNSSALASRLYRLRNKLAGIINDLRKQQQ